MHVSLQPYNGSSYPPFLLIKMFVGWPQLGESYCNTAYCLAISDFESLRKPQIKNSVDLGNFLNDKRCKDFLESINAVQHLAVRETSNGKRPLFLSLMADGGTDVSTKELELSYVRSLHRGSVANKFLKVHDFKDATPANGQPRSQGPFSS